jgi:hypothetical protein
MHFAATGIAHTGDVAKAISRSAAAAAAPSRAHTPNSAAVLVTRVISAP